MIPIKYRQAWSIGYKVHSVVMLLSRRVRSTLRVIARSVETRTVRSSSPIPRDPDKHEDRVPKNQQDLDEETLEKCRNKSAKKVVA